jgi:tetratricopeptide (TPR) repeat protein
MDRALLLISVVGLACSGPPEAPVAPPPPVSSGASSTAAVVLASGPELAEELRRIDATITAGAKKSVAQPKDWSGFAAVASGHMQRARLTGEYAEYAAAEVAVDAAFERAIPGTGPYVLRAKLNSTLHRLDRVQADLDHVEGWLSLGLHKKYVAMATQAGFDFQMGRVDEAKRGYAEAMRLKARWVTPIAGLALIHWKTGDFESAEGLYNDCLKLMSDRPSEARSWTYLQLGLMDLDRGRYADALEDYLAADAAMPGYWLVHEHIAEVLVLVGRTEEAAAIYEAVLIATNGAPEFLDAKAEMAIARGDRGAAVDLVEKSREGYEARLAQFPEASYGHALDHFLTFGPRDRALELAEKNHALRPNGEAKAALIEAFTVNLDRTAAAAMADDLAATPFRGADGHLAMSVAFESVGRAEDAAKHKAAALAINPRVAD